MSSLKRLGLIAGSVVVLVAMFVVLRGSDDGDDSAATTTVVETTAPPSASSGATATATVQTTTTAEPARTEVDVVGGKPKGGIKEITVRSGERVRFDVDSDVADEIHVHGYDLKKDVTAGGDVAFDFKASIEGKFEIELENAGVQIAELTVNP